ncbi:uncharacterized protein LOC117646250 [Thrips palmi]|uniref:Uncharacterized protein LOC117646250 n=1 Tax=Thrips palmi TaxID=161013 RepID=A0A6P8Z054_THRPL|nr:uncharacterized protein LOC117646250 [Thrips palmi]
MSSLDEFQKAMHDIYKYSPLIGLEGQGLLQSWVQRLVAAGAGNDQDVQRGLDYARYLAYQLERAQLRFPFSQPPPEDALPDLKEVLFGSGAVADSLSLPFGSFADDSLDQRSRGSRAGTAPAGHKDYSLDTSLALRSTAGRGRPQHDGATGSPRREAAVDPKCERDIVAQLEDLAQDAPLWLLLTRLCPHTLDGGALLHAVVAEELAEWSARLAAEQTVARTARTSGAGTPMQAAVVDEEDEEWGPRANRRADYWHEIVEAEGRLGSDVRSAEEITAEMEHWLNLQSRQMQAEQAQLQALMEELQGIQRQVTQSKKWRESQFEMQNRVLEAEVAALKQSIAESSTKVRALKGNWQESSTSPGAQKRLSISHDSLNASAQSQ